MKEEDSTKIIKREVGKNVWLEAPAKELAEYAAHKVNYEVLPDEKAVGQAMFDELRQAAAEKKGDIVMLLLGGRGAQALHKLLGEKAKTSEIDDLLARLRVFTQDALAPLAMNNSLSFVRDFERLLGEDFLRKVKSFTAMHTESDDLEAEMKRYYEEIESLGGIDIFFIGLGPEDESASHICYIKPGSGAAAKDFAGVIPISESILEHHISKFKAGGSRISEEDEAECRRATHILTLAPAAVLSAKKVVQSVVDASTAPAKKACYKKFVETELADDLDKRAAQLDKNPGLWLRLHPNFRSLILADVLEQ